MMTEFMSNGGDRFVVRQRLRLSLIIAAIEKIDIASGQVYNVGGGPDNVMSIWYEFGPILEKLLGETIEVARGGDRPGRDRGGPRSGRRSSQARRRDR